MPCSTHFDHALNIKKLKIIKNILFHKYGHSYLHEGKGIELEVQRNLGPNQNSPVWFSSQEGSKL